MARAVAPGLPHHVVQRGNNRENVFFVHEDREVYLYLMKKYAEMWNTPVICYCLMTNHVHFLARPSSSVSLQKMMQGVTLCYTQHINRKYRRTGRLWGSRYYSCIVDQEVYLWAVARYIEQNPVRTMTVEFPEDYPYSSARAHAGLLQDPVLGADLFHSVQTMDYVAFLKSHVPAEELNNIRQSTRTGRPLGTGSFITEMERSLGKRLAALPVGRPRNVRA